MKKGDIIMCIKEIPERSLTGYVPIGYKFIVTNTFTDYRGYDMVQIQDSNTNDVFSFVITYIKRTFAKMVAIR